MKKRVSMLLAFFMLFSILGINTEIYGKENYIKVGDIKVLSPYDFKDINVKHYEDNSFYYADVLSKFTGEILIRYKEEKNQDISLRSCGRESVRDLTTTFYDNPVEVTVRAECLVYDECLSTGNRTYVKEVRYADHYISSSGYFELKNERSTIFGNKVQCTGTMEIDINKNYSEEYSLDFLKSVGFSVSYSSGIIYHLRRPYNHTVEFR